MTIINNIVSELPRTNGDQSHESTNNGLIDGIPVDNAEFPYIRLFTGTIPSIIYVKYGFIQVDENTGQLRVHSRVTKNYSYVVYYLSLNEWTFTVDGKDLEIRKAH